MTDSFFFFFFDVITIGLIGDSFEKSDLSNLFQLTLKVEKKPTFKLNLVKTFEFKEKKKVTSSMIGSTGIVTGKKVEHKNHQATRTSERN